MKRSFILFLIAMVAGLTAWAQVPQTLTYQAVVRDGNGRLICNSNVGVKISILQGSESGVAVYSDQQTVRTNANGLFTLLIGTAENSIGGIDWAAGPYYLKSEIDHTGGSNYTLATVQQLFSVPYALRAHTVDSIVGGINYNETDPVFSAWDKDYNDLINRPTIPTMVSELTNDAGYLTFFTESQILSISNDTIFLTGGSFVKLPAGFSGDYNDLTNKPNFADSVSRIVNEYHLGDTIINYISQNGYVDSSYVINYNTQQGYVDTTFVTNYINNMGSVTSETDPVFTAWDKDYNDLINRPNLADSVSRIVNEYHLGDTIINYISQNGYVDSSYVINYNTQQGYVDTTYVTNYINNGGAVTSESDPVFTAWDKDYNDLINKPTIPTSVSELTNDAGYLTTFTEEQILSISNDTIYLTGGSFVKLPAGFSGDYNDLTNKPTIPTVPTNVSEFTNDAGYLLSYTEEQTLGNVVALGNTAYGQLKEVSDPTEDLDAVNLRTLTLAINDVITNWTNRFDSITHRYDSIMHNVDSIIAYQDSVIDTLSNLLAELGTTASDTTAVECESFNWYGTSYTVSGDYQHRLTNVAGFDSVLTMHLTINHGTHNAETQVASGSYIWHGTTYTESGNYTYTYTNAAGCASVDTLHLTIVSVGGFNSNGASNALFSVTSNTKVRFSKGNLQYKSGTWRFADNQYDYIGEWDDWGWIDLFAWGTSGWNSGANCYSPTSSSTNYRDYYPGGSYTNDLTGTYARADWGVYNRISNGGNTAGLWRTLTYDEWQYLIYSRSASTVSGTENGRCAKAKVDGVNGLIVFPDIYSHPAGVAIPTNVNALGSSYTSNVYSSSQWSQMEDAGCIFLPAAGCRWSLDVYGDGNDGKYWSTTSSSTSLARYFGFSSDGATNVYYSDARDVGRSVRLVMDY